MNVAGVALEATCYYAVKALLDPDLPANSGLFESIRLSAPEGSILNPRFPAATAVRAITCNRAAGATRRTTSSVVSPWALASCVRGRPSTSEMSPIQTPGST